MTAPVHTPKYPPPKDIPAATITPPLNTHQKAEIVTWLGFEQHFDGVSGYDAAKLGGFTDQQLIDLYKKVVGLTSLTPSPKGTQVSVPGWQSVLDFLKTLADPHLWLRVLEVLIGLLALGVGFAKIYGGPVPGVPRSVSETLVPKPGKGYKYV